MEYSPRPETVSGAVVSAVADAEDVSPLELTPLASVLDPDALDALFASDSMAIEEVRFDYEGYTVVVDDNRDVTLLE
jgi:hypothetical protein